MSLESHILHLQAKHSELEEKLAVEMTRPNSDFYVIKDIKKQKLLIKEEISNIIQANPASRQSAS